MVSPGKQFPQFLEKGVEITFFGMGFENRKHDLSPEILFLTRGYLVILLDFAEYFVKPSIDFFVLDWQTETSRGLSINRPDGRPWPDEGSGRIDRNYMGGIRH